MKIRYTSRALGHLEDIRAYLAEQSPEAASQVLGRIGAAIALLAEFPYLGHETPVPDARIIVAAGLPYLIAYGVAVNEVVVLGVFHARQNHGS